MSQQEQTKQGIIEKELIAGLAPFFDLLAKFDYEDKEKEKLAVNSGSVVSAPTEPEFGTNSQD